MSTAVLSPQQGFTIDRSQGASLSAQEHANRVNRIVSSYLASTPGQRRSGNRWYARAHAAAVEVAAGGTGEHQNHVKGARLAQRKYGKPSAEAISRSAGAIARLSPSMPAGMTWEQNPLAAHETAGLTREQVDAIRGAVGQHGSYARYVPGTKALKHAGGLVIPRAAAILHGEVTPEEDLNQKPGAHGPLDVRKKEGSFYRNIVDPLHSREVTIDARSAGVAAGKRLGFADVAPQVGKMEGTRYKDYERAYQDATDIINAHLAQAGKAARLLPHQVQATTWLADRAELDRQMNQGGPSWAHLYKGPGGHAIGRLNFPTPVGQGRTYSA